MSKKIKAEVMKQFNTWFLVVTSYPQWVVNVVSVSKKYGKVCMCIDYRDINRESPKDDIPLRHIDVLVDNTAQHKVFSFMDGFSRYNQIKMVTEYMENSKVMPFGLKNSNATYQDGMVDLFHDMIHHEIEVYVDDMIADCQTEEEHLDHLHKLFERLKK